MSAQAETVWEYSLLTFMGRDGNTLNAVDENGERVEIRFERHGRAATFEYVLGAVAFEKGPENVRMELRVTEDLTDPKEKAA